MHHWAILFSMFTAKLFNNIQKIQLLYCGQYLLFNIPSIKGQYILRDGTTLLCANLLNCCEQPLYEGCKWFLVCEVFLDIKSANIFVFNG